MGMRRRDLLGGFAAGLAGLSGCVEGVKNTVSGCTSALPDDARSPSEFRAVLPEYEGEAATEEAHWDRADVIQDALWRAAEGHPWRCSMGQTMDDGELIIVVSATCKPRAQRYIPDEWGGVRIQLRQIACGSIQLQ